MKSVLVNSALISTHINDLRHIFPHGVFIDSVPVSSQVMLPMTSSPSFPISGTVHNLLRPGPKVIKLFSCSTQLSLKFILLINVKMPTIVVGILTFMSRINYQFLRFEPEFSIYFDYFSIYEQLKFHAQLS